MQETIPTEVTDVPRLVLSPPRTQRRHFNEIKVVCTKRVVEDCHETWYSDEDYVIVRPESRACIQRLRRIDQENDDYQDYTLSDILRAML